MTQVHILFHSVSGHTYKLAQALGEGVRSVSGCEARLLRIPELPGLAPVTMSGIDQRVHDFAHVPEAKIEDLLDCDGLAIGSAVYWGNMSYATKHFLDSAARLWGFTSPDKSVQSAHSLARKPATVFTGGGSGLAHDPAILGMWTVLGFFGMTLVTIGLGVPEISDPSRRGGGSPLGAGTFSRRPGQRPSQAELAIARAQGRALAEVTRAWAKRAAE